jgi:hypothetical protein
MSSDEPTLDLDKDDEIIALLAERWPQCFMLAEDRQRLQQTYCALPPRLRGRLVSNSAGD